MWRGAAAFTREWMTICRRAPRLLVFACVSIALHVLTFNAWRAAGTITPLHGATTDSHVLYASLNALQTVDTAQSSVEPRTVRAQHAERVPTEAANQSRPIAAETSIAGLGRSDTTFSLDRLLPEKWYTAEELDLRAEPLGAVNIVYPEALGLKRIRGHVRLAIFIDEHGWVRNTRVIRAEPEQIFDEAAMKGWREVRFSPAVKDGRAVKSEKWLEVEFTPD